MLLNNQDNKKDKRWLAIIIGITFSILLLILNSMGVLDSLRGGISYVLDPIHITSAGLANNIGGYFSTLFDISEFRSDYNEMRLEIVNYKERISNYNLLRREYEDLKIQLELANRDNVYIKAQILGRVDSDYITINKGLQDGVNREDVVVLGNTYIGIVIESNNYTSKVRLPTSKSSFLESYVISADDFVDGKILSRGVVIGSTEGIKIENIGMNSLVDNGDLVIVNDSKVGENLVLGEVVALSEDPAETSRSGYVSPLIDYYNLINVFVRIRDVD